MKKFLILLGLLAGTSIPIIHAENSSVPIKSDLPGVSVVASDPTAFEGLSSGGFTIYRDGTNGDLAVNIRLSGTASNGVDYATLPSSVTIPAGLHSIGLTVQPLANLTNTANKRVELNLITNTNYQVETPKSAVVTIGDNHFENIGPSIQITSPADNTVVGQPVNLTITAVASDSDDSVKSVSFFANDRLLGSVKTPPYSLTWSNAAAGTYALFARAEDPFGKSTLSAVVHVTVTNGAPSIHITSPTDGAVFSQPANIKLEAEATGGNSAIKKISFYHEDDLIGTATSAPYSVIWSNAPRGQFTLIARATDAAGDPSYSQKVNITVTNLPPTVQITAPQNNSVFMSPTNIAISAQASDPDGLLQNVMFFDNSHFLATVKSAPYTLIWTNVTPGTHSLTARAVDMEGLATVSTPVHIIVSNTPPIITLTAPVDGSSFASPATIELKADASDADGILGVTFWSKAHLLGSSTKAPYSLTVKGVTAGSYEFTAKAIDRFEQQTVSATAHVTVTNSVTTGPHVRN